MLWVAAPDLAMILLATIPSGALGVAEARAAVSELMYGTGWCKPTLRSPNLACISSFFVYVYFDLFTFVVYVFSFDLVAFMLATADRRGIFRHHRGGRRVTHDTMVKPI